MIVLLVLLCEVGAQVLHSGLVLEYYGSMLRMIHFASFSMESTVDGSVV